MFSQILNNGPAEPRFLRIVTVTGCVNMGGVDGKELSSGLYAKKSSFFLNYSSDSEVLSQLLRICLVDGEKVISNIFTIKAAGTESDKKRWTFNNTVNKTYFS